MSRKGTQDSINLELSRAYFGGGRTPVAGTEEKTRDRSDLVPPKRRHYLRLWSLLAIAVMAFFAVLFLVLNRVELNISIKVAPSGRNAPSRRQPAKADLPVPRLLTRALPFHAAGSVPGTVPGYSSARILYDFENGAEGWGIPAWTSDKPDHVAIGLSPARGISTSGSASIMMDADFTGDRWNGALVEIEQFLDLSGYDMLCADIYLPAKAPSGLRARLIITAGEDWDFIEMSRSVQLRPGHWTRVYASLSDDSSDWKRTVMDNTIRKDIRKIAVRVESGNKPYAGSIYIDNVQLLSRSGVAGSSPPQGP